MNAVQGICGLTESLHSPPDGQQPPILRTLQQTPCRRRLSLQYLHSPHLQEVTAAAAAQPAGSPAVSGRRTSSQGVQVEAVEVDELVLTQLREAQSDLQFMVSSSLCGAWECTCARRVTHSPHRRVLQSSLLSHALKSVDCRGPALPIAVVCRAASCNAAALMCLQLKVGKWTPHLAAVVGCPCSALRGPAGHGGISADLRRTLLVVHSSLKLVLRCGRCRPGALTSWRCATQRWSQS